MKTIRFACIICVVLSCVFCTVLFAQTEELPRFEVASIKPAPPIQTLIMEIQSGKRGLASLQATVNDARVDLGYIPLNNLIVMAYKMKPYQIVGPDWMGSQAFTIRAAIPEGGSKEQVPEMLQSLLIERFKFASHKGTKEMPVYALLVSKDGHKMKEAVEVPKIQEDSAPAAPSDQKSETLNTPEGKVQIKQESSGLSIEGGKVGQMRINMTPNGTMALEIARLTMDDFADLLTQLLDRPVLNKSELPGAYQVSLEIPMAELLSMAQRLAPKLGIALPPGIGGGGNIVGANPDSSGLGASVPSGGGIFNAIEKLGLKLDSQDAPVETLVVDHIDKMPTEN